MFGQKRAPEVFYARTSLALNQVRWLTEKSISSKILSAAEDIRAVEGNVYKFKNAPENDSIFYINSSRYLAQVHQKQNLMLLTLLCFYYFKIKKHTANLSVGRAQ